MGIKALSCSWKESPYPPVPCCWWKGAIAEEKGHLPAHPCGTCHLQSPLLSLFMTQVISCDAYPRPVSSNFITPIS